jgi:cyclase
MLLKRIIPCLLIKDGGLIKTIKFKESTYIGDPINAVKILSEKESDEILILDIEATKKKKINYELLSNIFGECFVPITYGGGISTLDQAKKIINLGAEKICIQQEAFKNKNFISELSKKFGSQSVVLSIDIKKNIFGKYKLWNYLNNRYYKIDDIYKFISESIELGIGEILINDVDRDGTLKGSNKELIKKFGKNINIPTIFCGGINSISDIKSSFDAGAKAISAGSFFVFYGSKKAVLISYPSEEIKNILNEK